MVLTDILCQIWTNDAAYLFAKGTDYDYRLYVYGKDDGVLHGTLNCFKKGKIGWKRPYDFVGEGEYKQLIEKFSVWAGEDLNALDWKPRRPIT